MNRVALPAWARVGDDPRRQWIAAFVALFLVGALWSLATPLYGGPDEPAHTIRAASAARGQIVGRDRPGEPGFTVVDVPLVYARDNTSCFSFTPKVSAACQSFEQGVGFGEAATSAGRHPFVYHASVGLGSLVFPTTHGLYVMRLVSLALAAALVASAFVSLRSLPDRRLAGLGLVAAITPMVLFVFGLVNPSSLEIAAGIGTWSSGYVLVTTAAAGIDRRVLRRFVVAAVTLALARALGPMWLALILGSLVLLATRADLRALLRASAVRACAALVAATVVIQAIWFVVFNPTGGVAPDLAKSGTRVELFREALSRYWESNVGSMLGVFGWYDTWLPDVGVIAVSVLLGLVVVLGFATARRGRVLVLAGIGAAIIVVPAALDTLQAPQAGFIWQGRYTLPFAVGLPLVCACEAGRARAVPLFAGTRLFLVAGIVALVGQVIAFVYVLHRTTVGVDGPWTFWRAPDWSPQLPVWFLLLGFPPAMALFLTVVLGPGPAPRFAPVGGPGRTRPAEHGDAEVAAAAVDPPAGPAAVVDEGGLTAPAR